MKINIQILILLVLAACSLCKDEPTKLIYFIQYEEEQAQDYIEVSLQIKTQSPSLVSAISSAEKAIEQITSVSLDYCREYTKKGKGNCKEAVEVSKYEIKPNYQIIRKQSSFSSFIITHDFTVKVFNPENIGFLVDTFLKYPSITLSGFQWKPLQEVDSEEAAIKAGYEEGEDLCEQIGLTLSHIIDIEQLNEKQPAEEQEQEQQQEPAPDVIVYRFEVECQKITKK